MELIEIKPEEYNVQTDIVYATDRNVTGKAIYKNGYCFLHTDAAAALKKASEFANKIGYKIKIFDAFRPLEAQWALWNKFPDPEFVSDPQNGVTPHCRGIAVDMTLVDANLKELDMGTEFDAFTPLSHHGNQEVSIEAQKNRYVLMGIMAVSGWKHNPNEWWHYQLPFHEKYKKYTDIEAKTCII
ncbi:MAG: D-alanyl-D-alanine dipeptidase [Rickettsiales bacterium]|nr:D-alanyl-D-alanine dipeptidase [Pseudomonadota bacterium]MDA0967116.1 D-alanyl-D-alanine dipeptidase [Pseudomonadota bacterium]MDG4542398.1 D-alanyl-D-alanine dipeptidase [Rickettsiales bacterium]MDG4544902.1 D-alanyl-D-alanine dipeptidase [Rickettsiales bacterium]MDG4547025.1 D-alanyl-D-alanine dipeptidase [Rickettsiales bacterium]